MTERIRVLYVIGTLDIGGAEGQLVQLATRLDRGRFEVAVCCLAGTGPHAPALVAAGIPVHGLHWRGSMASCIVQAVPRVGRLVRLVCTWRPHIVHGVLFWAYVMGAFAARVARVPVVVASRRSLSRYKRDVPYRYALFLEHLANRLTDRVVANSEAVRADALATEGLEPDQVVVIPNGIDVREYDLGPDTSRRTALGIADGAPVVGVVANFLAYKGHEVFLDAWRRVLVSVPDAVAILIGDGPVRPAIETRAATLGVAPSLRFLGTRRDVAVLLRLVDVVAHPSFEEGFSNAVLEALAAGRPVVATAVGGTTEAVRHGCTGMLVPAGDPGALAEAIVRLLSDRALAARLGAAAARAVARRFTVERMVAEYERLYEALLISTRPTLFRRPVHHVRDCGTR